jgi:hypothetical protein
VQFRPCLKRTEPFGLANRRSIYDAVDSNNDAVCRRAFSRTMEEKGGKVVILNQHDAEQPIAICQLGRSLAHSIRVFAR